MLETVRVSGTLNKSDEPEIPKSIHIRKAEGGYIARKEGGKLGYEGKEIVSKDLKDLLKTCGEFLK